MNPNVTVFVNHYPKTSHTFIRREILELERQGCTVHRMALRGWEDGLVDEQDREERLRTRYVLQGGVPALIWPLVRVLVTRPLKLVSALTLALRMGHRSERPWPYHLVYLAEACRVLFWVRALGTTHVHAHFGTNSAEVAMLVHALGGPRYSFTSHGTEVTDKPEFLGIPDKVRRAAFVVAVSEYGRAQLWRWVEHALWRKVHLVRCGLESGYRRMPSPPLRASASRFVCVGRISNEKGQMLLVESVSQLAERGRELELVLVGDGEMRADVQELIAKKGLEERITITGWVGSKLVREHILAARALVVPSFAEGLPVVIMEAMALRRPVLASCVGGIPELVVPGQNGWLFPAGSVDGLTLALEDALGTPEAAIRDMGEAARVRVEQLHSIEKEVAKLIALFRKTGEMDGKA